MTNIRFVSQGWSEVPLAAHIVEPTGARTDGTRVLICEKLLRTEARSTPTPAVTARLRMSMRARSRPSCTRKWPKAEPADQADVPDGMSVPAELAARVTSGGDRRARGTRRGRRSTMRASGQNTPPCSRRARPRRWSLPSRHPKPRSFTPCPNKPSGCATASTAPGAARAATPPPMAASESRCRGR